MSARFLSLALLGLLACRNHERASDPPPAEDKLPAGATVRLGGTAFHHEREVLAISTSADGELVAAATGEDVRVWSARTGAVVRSVPAHGSVTGFGFAGGRLLFTAGERLVALEVSTGGAREYRPCGPRDDVTGFAASADARAVVVACAAGPIVRLDLGDGSVDTLITVVRPRRVAWSADGAWLAISADDLVIVDVAARAIAPPPPGRTHADAVFAPAGAVLAYAAEDDESDAPALYLYDLGRRTTVRKEALPSIVDALAWSRDGRHIALASDQSIGVLDVATGTLDQVFAHATRIRGGAFADPAGQRLWIAHDHAVEEWDLAADRALAGPPGHTGAITRLAFSPDGKALASGGTDTALRLWTVATRASRVVPLPDLGPRGDVRDPAKRAVLGLAFTADGAALLEADALSMGPGRLRTFAAATGVPGPSERRAGSVNLYDVVFAGPRAIRLYADEGTWHNALAAVSWPSGEKAGAKIAADSDTVRIAATADGTLAAAALDDKHISVVDTSTGATRATVPGRFASALALSPDGRWLAVADDAVRVYDVATAAVVATVPLPAAAASVSAAGTNVVIGTSAGDVLVVGLASPRAPKVTAHRGAHAGVVRAIAVAPDGKSFATGGDDGQILLWPL